MESSISSLTYKGSIAGAIVESKKQKKLFVVYISGDNAASAELGKSTWTDSKVAESLSKYCILLHIPEGSTDAVNFSAIYRQNSAPCITAIGYNGVQLWQSEGFVTAEVLASGLEKAWLTLHIQETTATVLTATLASKKPEPSGSSDIGSSGQGSSSGTVVPAPSKDRHIQPSEAGTQAAASEVIEENKSHEPAAEEKFSVTSTLRMVKDYVDRNQASGTGAYDLAIPYPRKIFSDQDLNKSLSELSLLDRQALIVVFHQRAASYHQRGSLSDRATTTTSSGSVNASDGGYFAYFKRILSYFNPLSYFGGSANSSSSGTSSIWLMGTWPRFNISE
ncbi:hypothetical protein OIU78_028119 [Salix suchowensis]|nr:hypothetical protein OIU78_028119 [Salix suchowensis]